MVGVKVSIGTSATRLCGADGKTVLFDEESIGGGVQYVDVQDLGHAGTCKPTFRNPPVRNFVGSAKS